MQTLGITFKEIATIYSFLPISSLLGPPTSGLMADTFGTYKLVMVANMILSVLLHVALLYIPSRPLAPSLTFTCDPEGYHLIWQSCDLCHEHRNHTQVQLTLENCKYQCETPPEEDPRICLGVDDQSHCIALNLTDQILTNGTVVSWLEEDTCSHTWYDLMYEDKVFQGLACPSQCSLECQVNGAPPCNHPDDPTNSYKTFWLYFGIRMVGTFFMSSAFTMCDATTLALLKQHGGQLGIQRLYTLLGFSVGPLLAGFLVDKFSTNSAVPDYSSSLYLGLVFVLLQLPLVSRLHFTVDMAGDNVMRHLAKLMTRMEINVFLVMILLQGSNWGFIESFLFVYLKELGAPTYLLGLTLTVGNIVGAPLMIILDRVVDKLSRPVVFTISFLTYSVRHFGYSFINDPWLAFPFEILEVFTSQLMWLAALSYCPILAPRGLLATMTGLAGSVHYSLGRGAGSLLGGVLISTYGTTSAFRIFGYMSLSCGILYYIAHHFYLKDKLAAREEEEELPEEQVEEKKSMLEKSSTLGSTYEMAAITH
ncbi:major facilitator superfamily domain-containing protein 6-like isoform X2 [Homarus americanus]|nr:major facilitator superfamily domain-containing protein 6-like isoform X2 [Homarus americanus]